MHFEYFTFLLYIILFLWQVPRLSFIKNSGLKASETRFLIICKVLAGFMAAFYFEKVFTNSDYRLYNEEGMLQYRLLLSDPKLFFTDFSGDIQRYGLDGVFEASNSFWGYLRFHLLFKFIAFLNLISRGDFYLNSAIFSSLTFFGHMGFYRIYSDMYKGKQLLQLLVCFFLPSALLYTSCVHKDGLVFISLGISSFIFYRFLQNAKNGIPVKTLLFILAVTCIFLFRNYVLVALLPAMFAAWIAARAASRKNLVFIGIYAVFALLFFLSGLLHNSLNLPAAVVQRKADFALVEKGSTNLPMNELEPTVISFVKNIPQAINHVMLRPYPFEFGNTGVLLASLELYFYLLLMAVFIFSGRKHIASPVHPFNRYGFAFAISMILIIGFTIPNVGAIVRYRSIIWILLLCPLVCNFDYKPGLFRRNNV